MISKCILMTFLQWLIHCNLMQLFTDSTTPLSPLSTSTSQCLTLHLLHNKIGRNSRQLIK